MNDQLFPSGLKLQTYTLSCFLFFYRQPNRSSPPDYQKLNLASHFQSKASPLKKSPLSCPPDPSPAPKSWSTSILTNDPLSNPLSQSTTHLFKRYSNLNLSRSLNSSHNSQSHASGPAFHASSSHLGSSSSSPKAHQLLSQSVRKVSNPNTLHRLLEETL